MNTKSFRLFVLAVLVSFLSACVTIGGKRVDIPANDYRGEPIKLEGNLYLPEGKKGPFPVMIFSHGSQRPSGGVSDTSDATDFFLGKGFAVLHPMRRGHGLSGGRNNEPLCNRKSDLNGLIQAVRDLKAATDYVKSDTLFDSSRIVLSGQSRGGLISVMYATKLPVQDTSIKGVVNFAGGWDGCSRTHDGFFKAASAGTKVPMLWIYGDQDSRRALTAEPFFKNSDWDLTLKLYPGGHHIIGNPSAWRNDVSDFLKKIGF